MFDMTSAQEQAFSDATNGVSVATFNHLILFLVGVFATIWLMLIIVGVWQSLKQQKLDMGEALGKICFALLIYIAVGSMIFF